MWWYIKGKTMEKQKLKTLNKETVTWAIMHNFNFSSEILDILMDTIWNSDELLESFQASHPIEAAQEYLNKLYGL
jgi:hypothetical protein